MMGSSADRHFYGRGTDSGPDDGHRARVSFKPTFSDRLSHRLGLLALTLGIVAFMAPSAGASDDSGDILMDMSLDQLMQVEVTTVSKKPEKLSDAAAAIFVIRQDDIQRSGATNLPEVLRMVPGVQVGRIDGNRWAVTARGFNGAFANKLLVLVDGRSVYTVAFSGVYWDIQDLPVSEIERIEVIRGPGATLWGVNAVNGVINVITKTADATQGVHLETGGGSGDVEYYSALRYGGRLNENVAWRVSGRVRSFGPTGQLWKGVGGGGFGVAATPLGDAQDARDLKHLSFRSDAQLHNAGDLTVLGAVHDGSAGSSYLVPAMSDPYVTLTPITTNVSGANLLARWSCPINGSANRFQLQVYYDRTHRDDDLYGETINTLDVDVQQAFSPSTWLSVLTGAQYRSSRLSIKETDYFWLTNSPDRALRFLSGFVQGDLSFWHNRVGVTIGAKLEDTQYSGAEFQPNARMSIQVAPHHTVWAALSRASRTPSTFEREGSIWLSTLPPLSAYNETPLTFRLESRGSDQFESETVTAAEAGYRTLFTSDLSLDLAVFHNEYRGLQLNTNAAPEFISEAVAVQALVFTNGIAASTQGAEAAVDWQPVAPLTFKAAYSYLDMDLKYDPAEGGSDIVHTAAAGFVPRHQVSLRSQVDVREDWAVDLWLRTVDQLPALELDAYTELDARVQWRTMPNMTVAVVGRNLLHREHAEYNSELTSLYTGIKRSGYVSLSLTF